MSTSLFACGRMLELDGVNSVCLPKSEFGIVLYAAAGAFVVERRDAAGVRARLDEAKAAGEFVYGGTSTEMPGDHEMWDRVNPKRVN